MDQKIIFSYTLKEKKGNEFNVGIRPISNNLLTYLTNILHGYKVIVFISHSMGGLIVKKTLVNLDDETSKKIKLFFSLSVPHLGSALAKKGLASLLRIKNPQVSDLGLFGEFTNELTQLFSELKISPKSIYQWGNNDTVVNEGSAIPGGILRVNILQTDDTHYTPMEVETPTTHAIFQRLITELNVLITLQAQTSIDDYGNSPVTVTFPPNCSFVQAVDIIVTSANGTFQLIGFEKDEESIEMKECSLSALNTVELLQQLKFAGKSNIPDYTVNLDNGIQYQLLKS